MKAVPEMLINYKFVPDEKNATSVTRESGSPARGQEEDDARGGLGGPGGIAEEQIERGGRIARASCLAFISFSATVWLSH